MASSPKVASLSAVVAALSIGVPHAFAETWVPLGGNMGQELDLNSILRTNPPTARTRMIVPQDQGTMTSYITFAALCGQNYVYLLSGEVTSTWSPKVMTMPDLPDEQRLIPVSAPNKAFETLYSLLCGA